jgi:hypothetical protein
MALNFYETKSILDQCYDALIIQLDYEDLTYKDVIDLCKKFVSNVEYELEEYERNIPAGCRFHRDEHGNVVYHRHYSGAPLLPYRQLGMSPKDFSDKYMTIDKSERTKFFQRILTNYPIEKIHDIINILIDYEHITPDDDKQDLLVKMLTKFICNELPNVYKFNIQYKYLLDISKEI